MLEIGRVCIKTAGRASNSICVVVDTIDKNFVLIDGNLKRKKCNITHLEPLSQKVDIKKGADTKEVLAALQKSGFDIKQKRPKKQPKEKTKDEPRKNKGK